MLGCDTEFIINSTGHSFKTLASLRSHSQFADVLLLIGNKEVPIMVHSAVLACNSEYYNTAFATRWRLSEDLKLPPGFQENSRIHAVLKHPDVQVDVMNCILDYLYTGATTIPQTLLIKVALFSNQILLDGLKDEIGTQLASKIGVTYMNALEYYNCGENLGLSYSHFAKRALLVMADHLKDSLVAGREWLGKMDEKAIAKMLEFESILTAAQRWEVLVSWSKTRQNLEDIGIESGIPSDFDVEMAQADMVHLVNLVGLCHLNTREYSTLVGPIKCLLQGPTRDFVEAHFSKECASDYLFTSRMRASENSKILNDKAFAMFLTQVTARIDRTEPIHQIFDATLLFRGSTAAFYPSSFHAACDGKKNTVTLVKLENGMIIGGYGDSVWLSVPHNTASIRVQESFVFSIDNKEPMFKVKWFQLKPDGLSAGMRCSSSNGPSFRLFDILGKTCVFSYEYRSCYRNSEKWPIWTQAQIEEYEVYQLS
ncbi:hypothetical protein BDR26DRAFT_853010, partial [Obelidium mucronatum]